MIEVRRKALVMHSAERMFDVVNDIDAYAQFLPNCKAARVIETQENLVTGELTLGKAGIEVTFVTLNKLQAPELIELSLLKGPFKSFAGRWQFKPLMENACEVSFDLTFETNGLLSIALSSIVKLVADQMVQTFCQRADEIYGK